MNADQKAHAISRIPELEQRICALETLLGHFMASFWPKNQGFAELADDLLHTLNPTLNSGLQSEQHPAHYETASSSVTDRALDAMAGKVRLPIAWPVPATQALGRRSSSPRTPGK